METATFFGKMWRLYVIGASRRASDLVQCNGIGREWDKLEERGSSLTYNMKENNLG